VWVLSACDISVTGAMRGGFVRELPARGAVCVIATHSRGDAFTASMFVGRLLIDIYNPVERGSYKSLDEVFFATQYTTALLYDPLLPLFRRAEREPAIKESLGHVLGEFFDWSSRSGCDVRRHRHDVAQVLWELLQRHRLAELQAQFQQAGQIRPETLLFTAFGVPGRVQLQS